MQSSENSSSLKAGSTKNKNSQKAGINAQVSKKGFSKIKVISGTKTSQSQMDGNIVVVDGKVKTPKPLITKKYKEYTQEYLKLLEQQQEEQKKARQQNEVKVKSSLNSQNDSQMKNSSSMKEERSFRSSSKSEIDSEPQTKREKLAGKQKQSKDLTIEDLQKNVSILLEQTPTIFTFCLKSTSYKIQQTQIRQKNREYQQYKQRLIGSDNFIARPVQTFNFQYKMIAETVEKMPAVDTGVLATNWDIQDQLKLEKKTQYQILGQDIRKNVEKEFNNFLINPFSCLPLEKEAIDIHSRYEVPGAADYVAKEKDDKKNRTKKTGNNTTTNQNVTGLGQVSTANINKLANDTKGGQDSSKRQQSSQHSNKRNVRNAQLQMELKQEQQKIEEQQKYFLNNLMKKAKELPSQQERKLMANLNLEKMLKYIDRILNSQTFHKQYIAYRNYPEIQFVKAIPEEQRRNNFAKKKKQQKVQDVNKEALQYLFTFSSKQFEGYSVTSADWNPVNKDLLAVSYELVGESEKGGKRGLLMFWTLKNPAFPQKIFYSESKITACKFSVQNPNLIACGTHDGVILIYDIRKKDNAPIAQNKESLDKHTNTVWDIQWISKGKGNKGQSLVSISADGRITQWSMKKGLEYTDLMLLRRIPQSNKKQATQNMNFRFASGLSFQFLKGESSMYLATTQEGVIYRCSKSYTQQYLQIYPGHNGPIYKVRANPFFYDTFLTCSSDWSCKLWNWRRDTPLNSFQSLDLYDQVIDIEWSPNQSTVFASVSKDGRLELWDLQKKNMLDPICTMKQRNKQRLAPKTMVRFCRGDPVLVTGDINGEIDVYRLHREQTNLDFHYQREKVVNLLYPNGYLMNTVTAQHKQDQSETQKKVA